MNQQQRDNIEDAYAILAGIPSDRFTHELGAYYQRKPKRGFNCRTLACGAGWLSLHPQFHDIRIVTTPSAVQFSAPWGCWSEHHFGRAAFRQLFVIAGMSPLDHNTGDLSEKELLLYRIRRYLGQRVVDARHGAISDATRY